MPVHPKIAEALEGLHDAIRDVGEEYKDQRPVVNGMIRKFSTRISGVKLVCARKNHVCVVCKKDILPKEEYVRVEYRAPGIFTLSCCSKCRLTMFAVEVFHQKRREAYEEKTRDDDE